jgi:aminodeoxyfutalosine deaminase
MIHVAPWVVPIASPPIADGAVALDGVGRVVAVGRARELLRGGGGDVVEVVEHGGVLLPGLVNAHLHIELSAFAGAVPGGGGLAGWIGRLLEARTLAPLGDPRAPRRASAAMAARGTVLAADVTNSGATGDVLAAAGVEPVVLHEHVFRASTKVAGAIDVPHSTYTCDAALVRALGPVRSIHVDEDPAEAELTVRGRGPLVELLRARGQKPPAPSGLAPVAWLDALGAIDARTLLVHLTFAGDDTLAIAARRGATAVLCPRSNVHISGRLPPWRRVRAAGLRVALGTDSLASSPSLDVLGDVQALARAGADPAWLTYAATRGGALALERPERGVIAPGARPGLIALGDARGVRDPLAFVAHEAADAPARRVDATARRAA